jgi:hypothetical protein
MINRLDFYETENIFRKIRNIPPLTQLNDIFSFMVLLFPVIKNLRNEEKYNPNCYLCESFITYSNLAKDCSLDSLQRYIISRNLEKRKFSAKFKSYSVEYQNIDIRMLRLCIAHTFTSSMNDQIVIKYFQNPPSPDYYDFDNFIEYFNSKYLSEYKLEQIELKATVIKVLSEPPFVYHKNIKETVFRWILKDLHFSIKSGLNQILADLTKNSKKLHYIRLLIKKASQLNSNYIISRYFILNALKIIENEVNISKEIEPTKEKAVYSNNDSDLFTFPKDYFQELNKFLNFRLFLLACFKEALHNNESKAIELEGILSSINTEEITNDSCARFLETLKLENTCIIKQALSSMEVLFENTSLDYYNNTSIIEKHDIEEYITVLNEIKRVGDIKLNNIISFISKTIYTGIKLDFSSPAVIPFVYCTILSRFLNISIKNISNGNAENITPHPKEMAENILWQSANILDIDMLNGGAFLLYKYRAASGITSDDKNLFTISSIGNKGKEVATYLSNKEKTFTKEMLDGKEYITKQKGVSVKDKYYWTSITYLRENGSWVLQDHPENEIPYPEGEADNEINRYHFIRITLPIDIESETYSIDPQAVIVLFDNKKEKFDLSRIRYLLSLKNQISLFLTKHFDTDLFKSLIEDDKKLELTDKSNERYRKAFMNFDHGVVSKILKKWAQIDKSQFEVSDDYEMVTFSYVIGANIILSKLYSQCSSISEKLGFTSDYDPAVLRFRDIFDKKFKKIIENIINNESLTVTDTLFSHITNRRIIIPIPKFSFRAFIVLLILNIRKHNKNQNSYKNCKIEITVTDEGVFLFRNSYNKSFMEENWQKNFAEKKKVITAALQSNDLFNLQSTTFYSFIKYFSKFGINAFDFYFNDDYFCVTFKISLGNE